jgi:hypothetical protein
MLAIRQALATGMDWHAVAQLVREEKAAGNPVAKLIHSLRLDQNKITVVRLVARSPGVDTHACGVRVVCAKRR